MTGYAEPLNRAIIDELERYGIAKEETQDRSSSNNRLAQIPWMAIQNEALIECSGKITLQGSRSVYHIKMLLIIVKQANQFQAPVNLLFFDSLSNLKRENTVAYGIKTRLINLIKGTRSLMSQNRTEMQCSQL